MSQKAVPLVMDAITWQERLQAEWERYLELLLVHVAPDKVILLGLPLPTRIYA